MTDFIYIDGVEYRPDEDLVEKIKEYFNKKTANPFDKVALGEDYFFIGDDGIAHKKQHCQSFFDKVRYKNGNYCANYSYMVSRAKEENLLRRMWRFSMENGGDKIDWKTPYQYKYYLLIDHVSGKIGVLSNCTSQDLGKVYFVSEEVARKAKDIFEKEIIDVYGNAVC